MGEIVLPIEHAWERNPVDPAACTITLWDTHSGSLLQTLSGHTKGIYACRFSPDGKFIISKSGDDTIRIWNERGETVYSMRGLNNDRGLSRIHNLYSGRPPVGIAPERRGA